MNSTPLQFEGFHKFRIELCPRIQHFKCEQSIFSRHDIGKPESSIPVGSSRPVEVRSKSPLRQQHNARGSGFGSYVGRDTSEAGGARSPDDFESSDSCSAEVPGEIQNVICLVRDVLEVGTG